MRTIVRNAIITDTTLIGYGVTSEGTLAGDVDTPVERPFLNLKWGDRQPSFRESVVTPTNLAIWVHHTPGDYGPIDLILARLHILLPAIQARSGTSTVQAIDWLGDGPDLQDDGHRTIVKVSNYRVVGND